MDGFIDLITDQRFPWFYPRHFWRSLALSQKSTENCPAVAITFDIEEDYPDKGFATAPRFLEVMRSLLDTEHVRATFFVQGTLVPKTAETLRLLSRAGHEIGVHGLKHNNWGKRVWYLREEPLTTLRKEQDLQTIRKLFREFGLPAPRSFRSPNMNWRQDTFDLLEKYGYKVDSSWDTHRRPSGHYFRLGSLREIPVSSLPVPRPQVRFGLPFTVFRPFNLANVLVMTAKDLNSYLEEIRPPLVFLAHPWEFFPNRRFSYCRPGNLDKLAGLLLTLKKKNLTFLTMSELAGKLPKR